MKGVEGGEGVCDENKSELEREKTGGRKRNGESERVKGGLQETDIVGDRGRMILGGCRMMERGGI